MAKAVAKKRWFQIVAPKLFGERVVGETPAFDPKKISDRTLKVNMAALTNDMRKQNSEVSLLLDNIEGDKAKASFIGMSILPTSMKRLVRKGRTRLDQTIKVITKDEKVVTIKMLIITRARVQGGVFTAIQNESKRIVQKAAAASTYDQFAETVVKEAIQKDMQRKLTKIYPVRLVAVREFKLERFLKSVDLRKIKAEIAKKPIETKPEEAEEKIEESKDPVEEKQKSEEVKEEGPEQETEEKSEESAEEKPKKKKAAKKAKKEEPAEEAEE